MLIQASASHIPLADESVQCVVTSPPYWGLRQYAGEQREVWGDGWVGALGLEPTPDAYVAHMVEVFREVRRVLRSDGTLWLNLGDTYAAQRGGTTPPAQTVAGGVHGAGGVKERRGQADGYNASRNASAYGMKHKDLVGIPWMVAFALRADGWYLRSDIIWAKPNPMPESVTDRPTKSHEYLFLLTKSERYFYDADAIREPVADSSLARVAQNNGHPKFEAARERRGNGHIVGNDTLNPAQLVPEGGRNKRDVWTIPTHPYAEAHFATYPEALVEPCILAGSAAKACGVCGAPWERVTEKGEPILQAWSANGAGQYDDSIGAMRRTGLAEGSTLKHIVPRETTGWQPTCEHDDGSAASRVLDPFNGSGTTGAVALRLGREYVGTDLSAEYLAMAERRIGAVTPVAQTVEHAARVAGSRGAQLALDGGGA